jgi:four helix bundle protein
VGITTDFRDLRAWQEAMTLAQETYRVARGLPTDERFGMGQQLRRAAASVPANLAEGWGRRSRPEFVRYVRVANGSLRELQSHLLLCGRLGLAPAATLAAALEATDRVARLLTALERSMRPPHP